METAGGYRFGDASTLLQECGQAGLYTHSLFKFGPGMHDYLARALEVSARTPFEISPQLREQLQAEFSGCDREEDYSSLRETLAEQGMSVPTLFKHYAKVAAPEGVSFSAFNVDRDFGDCVDGFVMVDLTRLKPRKRKRYLTGEGDIHGGTQA